MFLLDKQTVWAFGRCVQNNSGDDSHWEDRSILNIMEYGTGKSKREVSLVNRGILRLQLIYRNNKRMESSKKSPLEVHFSKNNVMRPSVDDETSNDKNDDNDSSIIYFNTVPYLIPRVHFDDRVEMLDSYYPSKQSHQLQYQQKTHYVKQQQQQLKQQQQQQQRILNDYRIKYLKRILAVVSIMLVLQLSCFFGNMSTLDRNNENNDASSEVLSQGITEVDVPHHPSLSERRAVWEGEYGQSDWSRVPPHLQGYYSKFNGRYDSSGREASKGQSQEKDRHRRNHHQGKTALSDAETYGTADDDNIDIKERIDGQLQEKSAVTRINLRHQDQQQNTVEEEEEEEEANNGPVDVDPTEDVRRRQIRQRARERQRKRDRNKQMRQEKLLNR